MSVGDVNGKRCVSQGDMLMWSKRIMALSSLGWLCMTACAQVDSSSKPSSESAQVAELLQRGVDLLAAGEFADAQKAALEASKLGADSPQVSQQAAEILYQSGNAKKSVELFDRAIELAPSLFAYNWQRGIALCTSGDFQRGAEQFKSHHQVNPDDVENSAWYFLCVAKTDGLEEARKLVIPSRGDSRQPMMSILQMLKGELEPEQVMQSAIDSTPEGSLRKRAQFYADLYIGLYYDSLGQSEKAASHLKSSLQYDQNGYMANTARVYLADRFEKQSEGQ